MTGGELLALADAILRASGSGMRHYSMPSTRADILAAVEDAVEAGRRDATDRCVAIADAERDYRRECQAKALNKREARDFETMAIACVHVSAALKSRALATPINTVEEGVDHG